MAYTHKLSEVLINALHIFVLEDFAELLMNYESLKKPLRSSCYLLVASHSFINSRLALLNHYFNLIQLIPSNPKSKLKHHCVVEVVPPASVFLSPKRFVED